MFIYFFIFFTSLSRDILYASAALAERSLSGLSSDGDDASTSGASGAPKRILSGTAPNPKAGRWAQAVASARQRSLSQSTSHSQLCPHPNTDANTGTIPNAYAGVDSSAKAIPNPNACINSNAGADRGLGSSVSPPNPL